MGQQQSVPEKEPDPGVGFQLQKVKQEVHSEQDEPSNAAFDLTRVKQEPPDEREEEWSGQRQSTARMLGSIKTEPVDQDSSPPMALPGDIPPPSPPGGHPEMSEEERLWRAQNVYATDEEAWPVPPDSDSDENEELIELPPRPHAPYSPPPEDPIIASTAHPSNDLPSSSSGLSDSINGSTRGMANGMPAHSSSNAEMRSAVLKEKMERARMKQEMRKKEEEEEKRRNIEEEERRKKKEEEDRVKKDEEEKRKREEEEKEKKRIDDERMKEEEVKKRKKEEEEERLRKENVEKERLRQARQAIAESCVEEEDTTSVMSDGRSIGDSEGSAELTPKQLAQRKRRMREMELKNERLAREYEEKMKREEAEERKLQKRRKDTAEREALNRKEEEDARRKREEKRLKKLEKEERKSQKSTDKVADAAMRKKSTTSTDSMDEPKKKRGRPRKNSNQIDADRMQAEPIQKKRKIIESSSDEQIPLHSTPTLSTAASPITDRSNSTSHTPSLPTDASSSTTNLGASSSSAAREGAVSHSTLRLPPPPPPPNLKHSTAAGQKHRSSDSSEIDPKKSKLGGIDYVGKDARMAFRDMRRIPKKKPDEEKKKYAKPVAMPNQPQRQIEVHQTTNVPLVHPPSDNPLSKVTPFQKERDIVAGRIEKTAGIGRRDSDDSIERRPTVKQPRDKMKYPLDVREDPLDKIDMDRDKRKISNADTALSVKQARLNEESKGGSSNGINGAITSRMNTPSGRSPAYVQSPSSADSPHYGSPHGDGTRPRPIQQTQHMQLPPLPPSLPPPPPPPPPLPLPLPPPLAPSTLSVPPPAAAAEKRLRVSVNATSSSLPMHEESMIFSSPTIRPSIPPRPIRDGPRTSSSTSLTDCAAPAAASRRPPSTLHRFEKSAPPPPPPPASVPFVPPPTTAAPKQPVGNWMPDLDGKPLSSSLPSSLPSAVRTVRVPSSSSSSYPADPRSRAAPSSSSQRIPPVDMSAIGHLVNQNPAHLQRILKEQQSRMSDESRSQPPVVAPPAPPLPPPLPPSPPAVSVFRPTHTVHYFRDPRSRLEGDEKEREDKNRSIGWKKDERLKENMIEWEKNQEKMRREAVRDGYGYVMRFIDGLKFTPNQRLSVYRRSKTDHRPPPDEGKKPCEKCEKYGCYTDAITIAATDLARIPVDIIVDDPMNEGRIESTDDENMDTDEARDEPQSSMSSQNNGDALFMLRVDEESNSASDSPSLEPGFDAGIIPPLKTKDNGRRMETEEEAKKRKKYMKEMEEEMEKYMRMNKEENAKNVDEISQRTIKLLMEKERENGEMQKEKQAENSRKETPGTTSTQSTTGSTSSNLPISGTEARCENGTSSTLDKKGGGATSINTKKVTVNSERLARIRGNNEEMIKRSRGDGEKSSQKSPSLGVTSTQTAKHSKCCSLPSSSRSSDEHRQKSGDSVCSSSGPMTVMTPSSSTPSSSSPSIRQTSSHSRPSNEENMPQLGLAASAVSAAPPQLVGAAMVSDAATDNLTLAENCAAILQNALNQRMIQAQTGHSLSPSLHGMATLSPLPSISSTHSHQVFMQSAVPRNANTFAFHPPPPPILHNPYVSALPFQQYMPFPPMGIPIGAPIAIPPLPPPPSIPLPPHPPPSMAPQSSPSPQPTPSTSTMTQFTASNWKEANEENSGSTSNVQLTTPSTNIVKEEEDDEILEVALPSRASSTPSQSVCGSIDDDKEIPEAGMNPIGKPFIKLASWPDTSYEEDARTIIVFKYSQHSTVEKLKEYFEKFAKVEDIQMTAKSHKPVLFALVRFHKLSDVNLVYAVKGHKLEGWGMSVFRYLKRPPNVRK